jgi:hypothetical protein
MSVIQDVMDGWPEEDVETFARLFDRFIDRFEARLSPDTDLLTDQKKS